MNLLAHLTQFESPTLAITYVLGVVTGVVLSLTVAYIRAK